MQHEHTDWDGKHCRFGIPLTLNFYISPSHRADRFKRSTSLKVFSTEV